MAARRLRPPAPLPDPRARRRHAHAALLVLVLPAAPDERAASTQAEIPVYDVPFRDERGEFIVDFVDGGDIMTWVSQGAIADRTRELPRRHRPRGRAATPAARSSRSSACAAGEDPLGVVRDADENAIIELPQERDKYGDGDAFLAESIDDEPRALQPAPRPDRGAARAESALKPVANESSQTPPCQARRLRLSESGARGRRPRSATVALWAARMRAHRQSRRASQPFQARRHLAIPRKGPAPPLATSPAGPTDAAHRKFRCRRIDRRRAPSAGALWRDPACRAAASARPGARSTRCPSARLRIGIPAPRLHCRPPNEPGHDRAPARKHHLGRNSAASPPLRRWQARVPRRERRPCPHNARSESCPTRCSSRRRGEPPRHRHAPRNRDRRRDSRCASSDRGAEDWFADGPWEDLAPRGRRDRTRRPGRGTRARTPARCREAHRVRAFCIGERRTRQLGRHRRDDFRDDWRDAATTDRARPDRGGHGGREGRRSRRAAGAHRSGKSASSAASPTTCRRRLRCGAMAPTMCVPKSPCS